jgi:hypothetical protein
MKGCISIDDGPRKHVRSKQLTASNVISEMKDLLNADRILTVREISDTPDLVQGVFIIYCTKVPICSVLAFQ